MQAKRRMENFEIVWTEEGQLIRTVTLKLPADFRLVTLELRIL